MSNTFFVFLPALIAGFICLVILVAILYLVYTWISRSISLRKEQNELLREILKKLDKQAGTDEQ